MKLTKNIFVLLFAILITSCASVGINKKNYNEKIKKISIGMQKDDFMEAFPEAIPRGAKKYNDGTIEVLEVLVEHYSFYPTDTTNRNIWTGMEGHSQWFYFKKNELIQYGKPNDWPKEPTEIIELRNR